VIHEHDGPAVGQPLHDGGVEFAARVRLSRRAGRMTTWTSPPAIALREGLAMTLGKLAPAAALRGLAPIYDWHPPATTPK
jgi:hypothetical protein